MTPQEAIRRIKNHNEVHSRKEKHFAVHITEALNMAVEALEKQIPKKPVIKTHKYIGSDDDFVNKYHCPVCKALMINEDTNGFYAGRKQKYCDCGQALDWSDKNEVCSNT